MCGTACVKHSTFWFKIVSFLLALRSPPGRPLEKKEVGLVSVSPSVSVALVSCDTCQCQSTSVSVALVSCDTCQCQSTSVSVALVSCDTCQCQSTSVSVALVSIIGGSCHKYHFRRDTRVCHDKSMFVVTKVLSWHFLSRQTKVFSWQAYFCRNKIMALVAAPANDS